MKLHLSIFRDFWKLILKSKNVVSSKRNPYHCEDRIEKPVPQDHHLSSLGKPRDANGDPWDGFFLSYLTLMMDFNNITGLHV